MANKDYSLAYVLRGSLEHESSLEQQNATLQAENAFLQLELDDLRRKFLEITGHAAIAAKLPLPDEVDC